MPERPSLQPRADVVRSFFPNPGRGRFTAEDLPGELQRLANILGGPAQDFVQAREARAVGRARQLLEVRPDITEEELIEELGGHRTVARRLINENAGRSAGQEFGFRLRRELLNSPVSSQGPEQVREFIRSQKEQFFSVFPTEDKDRLRGAVDAVAGLEQQLINGSVETETANIIQTQENQTAALARNGLTLDGHVATVNNLFDHVAAGESSGVPAPRLRGAVITSFITWATAEENLFQGENALRELIKTGPNQRPPFIQDPQERATIADAIRTVRRMQDDRLEKDAAAKKLADDTREMELINKIAHPMASGQPFDDEDFRELTQLIGADQAARRVSAMREDYNELRLQADDPVEFAHDMDRAVRGLYTTTDVLALRYSHENTAKLLDAVSTGTPRSVFGTEAYKQVRRRMFEQLGASPFLPLAGKAPALTRLDETAVRITTENPELMQNPNSPQLMQFLNVAADQAIAEIEGGSEALEGFTPTISEDLSTAQLTQEAFRRARVTARVLSQTEEAHRLGQSRGLKSMIHGVDPFMRDVWGMPPDADYDLPEGMAFQWWLQDTAELPFKGRFSGGASAERAGTAGTQLRDPLNRPTQR